MTIVDFQLGIPGIQSCLNVTVAEAFARENFDSQDRDSPTEAHLADEGNLADGNWHGMQMGLEVGWQVGGSSLAALRTRFEIPIGDAHVPGNRSPSGSSTRAALEPGRAVGWPASVLGTSR